MADVVATSLLVIILIVGATYWFVRVRNVRPGVRVDAGSRHTDTGTPRGGEEDVGQLRDQAEHSWRSKRWQDCIDFCEHANCLEPHANTFFMRGICFYRLASEDQSAEADTWFRSRVMEADQSFRHALALDNRHIESLMWLGMTLARLRHRDAEAAVCFQRILEIDPNHPTARQRLALARKHA